MNSAPSIRDRYDEVSPTYEDVSSNEVAMRVYWLAYDHLTWSATERRLPEDGRPIRVLDAGGGGGKFNVRFAERGHHVTVLDISPGMVERARAAFVERDLLSRGDFHVGDVLALPFADASFDLVFCEGDPVSYCLDQHPKALSELVRVAKPGAPIILGIDNRYAHFLGALMGGAEDKAMGVLRDGRSLCPYGLPVHAFTLNEIKSAVTAAGADVEEIFGKPVLFFQIMQALAAERGPGFDAWEARDEIIALQERFAHEGYASFGGHLQVMARRR